MNIHKMFPEIIESFIPYYDQIIINKFCKFLILGLEFH